MNDAMEKDAGLPALALPAAATALGLYFGGSDIKEGLRRGSVGQTLWGAAQVPLAFVGSGAIRAGLRHAPKLVAGSRALSKIPGMARVAKLGRPLARAGYGAERLSRRVGGAMLAPVGALGRRIPGRVGNYMQHMAKSPGWRSGLGLTGLFMGGASLLGGPMGEQGGGAYGPYGAAEDLARYAVLPGMQQVRNVAPGVRFLGMPSASASGSQIAQAAQQYAPYAMSAVGV